MKPNTAIYALVLAGFFPFSDGLSAQDVKTISTGQRVNISKRLARNKTTIVEFYADW